MTAKPPARLYEPRVSDHAIVRWLERVEGVDIQAVRARILGEAREGWAAWGATAINIPVLRVQLILSRGVVKTVVPTTEKEASNSQ